MPPIRDERDMDAWVANPIPPRPGVRCIDFWGKQGSPPPPCECPRRRIRSPHKRTPAGPGPSSAAAIGRRGPCDIGGGRGSVLRWSGALMLRPARAGRGGVRVGRRARCRQKLGLGVSPLEDRWSNGLFFLIASGYQPPLAKVATPPPRYVASVATAPERCSWMSASPVTSVRRQPPRTVRERPRPSARMVAGRPRAPYRCTRSPRVAPHTSPSRRLRTFPLPVAPTRANVDGRRLPAAATTRRTRVLDPARDRLDHHPR